MLNEIEGTDAIKKIIRKWNGLNCKIACAYIFFSPLAYIQAKNFIALEGISNVESTTKVKRFSSQFNLI